MASALFGVEGILAKELLHLGFSGIVKQDGRVFFDADLQGIAMANICLRTAERVYIVIGECSASDSDTLYRELCLLPFGKYIGKEDAFPVDVNLVKAQEGLTSKSVTQKTAKRAVVESLRPIYRREIFEEKGAVKHVYVNILKDSALVLLDTSGSGLNRRGYREYGNAAPLRETLAAALVLLSGWRTDTKLIDAFCGSGTILIEAALYALGLPPNRDRSFVFETWSDFASFFGAPSSAPISETIASLRDLRLKEPEPNLMIEGYDIDPKAIRQARSNAKKAGVGDCIHFQVRDVRDLGTSAKKGTLLSNLPYGERLLDREAASEVNRVLGRVVNDTARDTFRHWYKCFYTSHEDFQRDYGMTADKNRKLYNGGMKSYLYLYRPDSRSDHHIGEGGHIA